MIDPALILHADWGTAPSKRWVATAVRRDGHYEIALPVAAGDLQSLVARAVETAGTGQVLVGFDFPIGVPAAWAGMVGVGSFLDELPTFGHGEWNAFYEPAERADEISARRPFYPKRPGGTRRSDLWQGLGLSGWLDLFRKCELSREGRSAASPLFWILGGKQVGRAAIIGWRDVLAPAMRSLGSGLRIWPFAGPLGTLTTGECVVVETYPADACLQIGLCAPGRGWSKRCQAHRTDQSKQIMTVAAQLQLFLSEDLQRAILDGFGAHPDGEDPFDAIIGLIAMLKEISSAAPGRTPPDAEVQRLEGWIFGQSYSQPVAA
jgi:hypothetical protein